MRCPWIFRISIVAMILTYVPASGAELTSEQVKRAIDRGVSHLKSLQNERGGWQEISISSGVSALSTLALINSGVPIDDPFVQRGLEYVRAMDSKKTYAVSLQTMVLCAADPKRDHYQIRENVRLLSKSQVRKGTFKGGWSYSGNAGTADNSNAQFALLALHEAERAGVEVNEQVWRLALNYWIRQQGQDGSWGYKPATKNGPAMVATGSMTCAGIASVIIASGQIGDGGAGVANGEIQCCGNQIDNDSVKRGVSWLANNFSVKRNPSAGRANPWWLYYLYAMERVGRMSGQRFIGQHDWYREGAEILIAQQDRATGGWRGSDTESQPAIGTSLALLFLSKGQRPVLAAKLQHSRDNDWNRHRQDLAQLTRHVETLWERGMTWQTIDIREAKAEDLLMIPVLFISGKTGLSFAKEQKETLKTYIAQGGFIFAEACCDGKGFDKDFRALVAELFPDSQLRLLPQDHPVWYAEQKVNPDYMRPLYGVDACCRTSVVYCPDDLSCQWQVSGKRNLKQFPQEVRDEIAACLAIGANVITYATNRELKEKLDTPHLLAAANDSGQIERSTLQVAKLFHGGGSDDAPSALTNLLRFARQEIQLRVSTEKRMMPITTDTLPDYPIAFVHGRRKFSLSNSERKALRTYLENGGFLLADAICASRDFAESFRRELGAVLPNATLGRIKADHEMLTSDFQGFDISTVRLRVPGERRNRDDRLRIRPELGPPELEAMVLDGRVVVVFSPLDMSCALENQASLECKGYSREDAAKIGVNVILYAMQQ